MMTIPAYNLIYRSLWTSLACLLLMATSGCSNTPLKSFAAATPIKMGKTIDLSNGEMVKKNLMAHYHIWKGTPYLYGGNSRHGIDCSAFVQRTFAERLGYKLPRTTLAQAQQGAKIPKKALQPGDIVFFKTGRNSRHNGIYIGNNQFMHASSSKGITISNLKNDYWQKTYWTAIRIPKSS